MQAAIIKEQGQTPILGEFPEPKAQEGKLLINVSAVALSNVAKARSMGTHYSSAGSFPRVAGMDGVGTLTNGQRVYFINSVTGSLAKQALVAPEVLIPIPDGLDNQTAASIANPGMSSYAALVYRAKIQPGDVVLINGASGTAGSLAVKMAYALGAKQVIVTGRGNAALTATGADAILATDTFDLNESTGQKAYATELAAIIPAVTIVLDYLYGNTATIIINTLAQTIGANHTIRYVQIGSIAGVETPIPAAALRSSKLILMGSGFRSVDDTDILTSIERTFQLALENHWTVPIQNFTLDEIEKAWQASSNPRPIITIN
ncbi:alcohol dehydrogenase zinc-binding domain-containing protein [Weissella oryzae SG25]|uniref:Alcohol dehydrogenase zinc-binding domain-containing protein n=1 Tax=Weissella oryzae (strain DSM 25784 / JCM 18191 / LMG 30913 / SG25) TaxID=1329250 RepID=A0A069CUP5_WEIOS|nr:hypothetical protein [Weissella oryzae]GAK31199.1 alcohol dehydrogenase zinc-binding domain-containing protein [Weissella oryzae SG25]